MRRVHSAILCVICLLIGLSAGWYWGYTRPVAENQRRVLKNYQTVRDAFGATDTEMADFGVWVPDILEMLHRESEMAGVVALNAIANLERGDVEKAKRHLAYAVRTYYDVYAKDGGDTNFVAHVDKVASQSPILSQILTNNSE